jgi:hypothetical protein
MMRIAWLTPADKARLRSHEPQMVLVAQPLRFANRQRGYVDLALEYFRI